MDRLRISLFVALLSAITLNAAAAQGYKHPLTDLPPAGELSVNHFFPLHATQHFPAGGEVKVVVGVRNDASGINYNMSAIMGSINSPSDFSLYIQNFTQQVYFTVVEPGAELSLEYTFRPDPALPARDYQVALTLFYEDEKDGFFSTTFFNGTIDITETPKMIDTEIMFLYLLIAGVVAAVGMYAYKSLAAMGFFKIKTKKVVRKPDTVKVEDEDEWLKGTNYDPKKKKVSAAAKKSS